MKKVRYLRLVKKVSLCKTWLKAEGNYSLAKALPAEKLNIRYALCVKKKQNQKKKKKKQKNRNMQ